MTGSSEIRVFFYGSFMSTKVLRLKGLVPRRTVAARLSGWALVFQPMANVVPAPADEVYGMITTLDRVTLAHAYVGDPLETYAPRIVDVHSLEGAAEAVACYVAPPGQPTTPAGDYLAVLVEAAQDHGLPPSWIERLRSYT